jgi:hypothetical protein
MLAEALKVHTALRTLSLDENRIGAEGASFCAYAYTPSHFAAARRLTSRKCA